MSSYRVAKQTDNDQALSGKVFFNVNDFNTMKARSPDQGTDERSMLLRMTWAGDMDGQGVVWTASAHHKIDSGCIGMSTVQRNLCQVTIDSEVTVEPYAVPAESVLDSMEIAVDLRPRPANGKAMEVDADKFSEQFQQTFKSMMFTGGTPLVMRFNNKIFNCVVKTMNFTDLAAAGGLSADTGRWGQLLASTAVFVTRDEGAMVHLTGAAAQGSEQKKTIFNKDFDFGKLGIGGLDAEFNIIFRRAFASRIFPKHIIEQLGVKHVKGMLLYGPPGCGKTLIARKIGEVLNSREPKIVNGPEILDKFVGGSEEKVRALFAEAEAEQKSEGDDSMLHIIIFDEFDAICKKRGSTSDNTGTTDTVVNQLLSKIDGVESLNNILLIGMTNRKDMIDEAILRPGRLEVHVEIGLPDERGRLQIIDIKTANMRKSKPKRISEEAENRLEELAQRTKNFTGAELEGLVRNAAQSAMNRAVKVEEDMARDDDAVMVQWGDFEHALMETVPKFGRPEGEDGMEELYREGMVNYGPGFTHIYQLVNRCVDQVRTSERTPLLTMLLEGPPKTGKTAIAAHLAVTSQFPFARIISPDQLVGLSEFSKCARIKEVFSDAYRSPLSCIVLDDLERLIEYVGVGPRFANTVLQTLLVLLKKRPSKSGNRLLIVATTSMSQNLADLGLDDSCLNVTINVPPLSDANAVQTVLAEAADMSHADAAAIAQQVTGDVGIKELLMMVEMAREGGEGTEGGVVNPSRFMECFHQLKM